MAEVTQCEANPVLLSYYIIRTSLLRRYNDDYFRFDYLPDLALDNYSSVLATRHRDLNDLYSVQHTLQLLSASIPK